MGSGKTTFLKRILDGYAGKKRIAVVQNEFAPENIDGRELRRYTSRPFDMLEINNGSVFCVCLLSGFIESLAHFINEHNPDIVFIEASGLSDPISVGEIFNSPKLQELVYLAGSICIVDAKNFLKLEKLQQRMIQQVRIANSIIINKIDLIESYEKVKEECRKINPFAEIYASTYCNLSLESVLQISRKKADISQFSISQEDLGRPDIISAVYKTVKPLKVDNFQQFINDISPRFIRLKGYVMLNSGEIKAVQSTMGQIQSESIDYPVKQTEIIAMGYEMTARDIKNAYKQYC